MSNSLNWSAIIAATVSIGAYVSMAAGAPALAAVISDPHTAQQLTSVVGGLAALVSAFMPAIHKGS